MTRLDRREDVLVIHTYLVDAELPFLCGKQTLESWNFKIDSREKILEIQTRSDQDCSTKLIKVIDTTGGHYSHSGNVSNPSYKYINKSTINIYHHLKFIYMVTNGN